MSQLLQEKALWKFIIRLAVLLILSCYLTIKSSEYSPVIGIGINFFILFVLILFLYVHYRSKELDLLKAIGQSSIAMALIDHEGKIRWVSDKMAGLYSLSKTELEGKDLKALRVKRTVTDIELLISEARESGEAKSYACIINPQSESQKITQTMLIPIRRGSFTRKPYLLFVDNDITELRQKEKEKIEVLKEADNQKAEIIKLFFHDLKSPLNVPIVRAKIILHSDNDAGKIKLEVKQILKELEGIKRWADSLSEWAKVRNNLIYPVPRKFYLKRVINEAIKYIEYAAELEEIKIINTIPRRVFANADPNMIESVCRNLISNSVEAISQRQQVNKHSVGFAGKISVSAEVAGNQVEISIQDNGIGMSEKDKEKMFDKHKGLGSLVACKFIEANNGNIKVKYSAPSEGTTISFTLPTIK